MEFHPGGVPELMRAAGVDCTQLFDEVSCIVSLSVICADSAVDDLVKNRPENLFSDDFISSSYFESETWKGFPRVISVVNVLGLVEML
jgi:hypothetical protein